MENLQERWNVLKEQSLQFHLHSADFMMQALQRLADLQFETAKRSIEESAMLLKALMSAKDDQELTALSTEIGNAVRDHTLSYAKSIYEAAVDAQAESARGFRAQVKDFSDGLLADVEGIGETAPIGGPIAIALVKSTVAGTNAVVETLSRAVARETTPSDDAVEIEEQGVVVPSRHGKGRQAA